MTRTEANNIVEEFLASPGIQDTVADILNYCARLCAAVAETHGFHDDEKLTKVFLSSGIADTRMNQEAPIAVTKLPTWLEAQLLTAEFGRVMSECGEAIENIRKPGPDDKCPEFPGWQVEAIDTMIRLFDTLGKRGINPGEIFLAKTLVNNGRAYKHDKNS